MSQSRPYFPNSTAPLAGLRVPPAPSVPATAPATAAAAAAPAPAAAPATAAVAAPAPAAVAAADPGPFKAKIIAFCCNYCAYAAADLAGSRRMQYPSEVRVIHVPCTGKVEPEHILGAFEKGADGVLIAGCLEGGCHFLEGNLRAKKRSNHLRKMLAEIGLGEDRLLMVNLSAAMAPTFVQRVNEIVETVHKLGPSPLNKKYSGRVAAADSAQQKSLIST
jgi:F420-non-reducing hydrogenase iron-sulfur subunit